jgi:CHAT domain-containing protein/Tfp pilus assembly protein PilF
MNPARAFGTLVLVAAAAVPACSGGSDSRERQDAAQASEAAATAGTPRPPGERFDALLSVAESTYFRGAYDSARTIWSGVVRDARAAADPAAEARALTWLGLAAWKQGDYPEASRLGEEALALKLRFRLEGELYKSYNALGLVAWNEGRLSRAKELFENALESARRTGDAKGVAGTSANLALVETDLGEFTAARNGFTTALAAGRTLGDERIRGNALANLGMLDIRVGDLRSAVARLGEARRLYRAIDYAAGEQNVLGQLGVAYASMGEPGIALAFLDSALTLARAQRLRQEEADVLEEIAEYHREAGDLRSALRLYEQARTLNAALGRELETGDDLRSQAEIHSSLGDLALAGRYAAEALRIHRKAGARLSELADLLLLARLAGEARDAARAEDYFAQGRRAAALLGTRLAGLEVALAEARAADGSDDSPSVLRALANRDLDLVSASYDEQWEAHALRARAFARLGMLDSADVVGRKAVSAVERTRHDLGSGILRTAYLADKSRAYADLVSVLLRGKRVEEAFEFADAARGRALLEHLGSAEGDAPSSSPTARSLTKGEELLRTIDALVSRLEETGSEPSGDPASSRIREELYARLTAARSEYEDLIAWTSDRDPASAAFLGGARVRVEDVQNALQSDEALVEYLVTADEVVVFVVTRGGVAAFHSGISAADLTSRIRVANDFLRRRAASDQGSKGSHVLTALHRTLMAPAVKAGALRGARRLVIVPHQAIVYLPFAALRDGTTTRYLIEDYSLLYLPSAAALPLIRRSDRLANADSDAVLPQVFAPFPRALPATVAEAAAFERSMSRARMHLGARATEARVREALAGTGLVHVASHARLNMSNPLFSRIELQPGSPGSSDDDGRLEVHELLGVPMGSALVFLSGCETGLGGAWSTSFARGADYATLAQAFLYAGARNVVATLWPVEDAGAAAFAERFYRKLPSRSPPQALAEAQREMLNDAKYHAPYYWAGYALSGTGELGLAASEV